MVFFTSRFGAAAVSAAVAAGLRVSVAREVEDFEELLFLELAGLATTFFGETGLVFFAADFPVAAFFVAALPVVFFEVPFFLEALAAVPRLVVARLAVFFRLVVFFLLDAPVRLAVARLAVFFRVAVAALRVELVALAFAVLPVFFFFFAAAL